MSTAEQKSLEERLRAMENKISRRQEDEEARLDLERDARAAELKKELARIEQESKALDELADYQSDPGRPLLLLTKGYIPGGLADMSMKMAAAFNNSEWVTSDGVLIDGGLPKETLCVKCFRVIPLGEDITTVGTDRHPTLAHLISYHAACFTCCRCSQPIAGAYLVTEEGPLCENCDTLRSTCIVCKKVIDASDEYLRQTKGFVHFRCFRCCVCTKIIGEAEFYRLTPDDVCCSEICVENYATR